MVFRDAPAIFPCCEPKSQIFPGKNELTPAVNDPVSEEICDSLERVWTELILLRSTLRTGYRHDGFELNQPRTIVDRMESRQHVLRHCNTSNTRNLLL